MYLLLSSPLYERGREEQIPTQHLFSLRAFIRDRAARILRPSQVTLTRVGHLLGWVGNLDEDFMKSMEANLHLIRSEQCGNDTFHTE
jgi:hypothetical protein